MSRTSRLAAIGVTVLSLLVAPGCGDDAEDGAHGTSITVSAASSLAAAFEQIGEDFEAANPEAAVAFSFAGSSQLASQILEGSPTDVFASADEATMAELTEEGLIAGSPEVFARNRLVIVTKPGNPTGIEGLADLAIAGTVSLCGPEVPCGRYARQALEAAGVEIPETSITRGQNAGATLTAVSEGDAAAGIVYASDAEAAGDAVSTVDIPDGQDVLATYVIGVTTSDASPDTAEAFMDWVLGDEGQAVLVAHGFLPPA
jgi:molybdate transport system substrate-binding protein